ncbi:MAG: amino acid deaminase [Rhodoglobus sp.]
MTEQRLILAELDSSARSIAEAIGRQEASRARIHAIIAGELPWLAAQILADRAQGRFADWARSTTIDENTGEPVISRELFEVLHEIAGLEAHWPIGNAGLLHCYGYLLSTASTPYGLKRDRWITADLATAFCLAPDAFTPWAGTESLLSRVASTIIPVLSDPPVAALAMHTAITEPDAAGVSHTTRTVVVQRQGVAAVVYGLMVQRAGVRVVRPVTVFPVSASPEWLAELAADTSRLRFNAVAATIPAGAPNETLVVDAD